MPPVPSEAAMRTAQRLRRGLVGLRGSAPVRRAAMRRAVAVLLAALLAGWSHHELDAAHSLRRQWHATEAVVVTTRGIALGEVLDAGNTALQTRPADHVPEGALRSPPEDRRAAVAMPAGEVVIGGRLTHEGSVAARVPEGRAAVGVEVGGLAPRVGPGDHVQLVAPGDTGAPTSPEPTADARLVAADAIVLGRSRTGDDAVGTTMLTVAVPGEEVTAVAGASLLGPLAVVVAPAGG